MLSSLAIPSLGGWAGGFGAPLLDCLLLSLPHGHLPPLPLGPQDTRLHLFSESECFQTQKELVETPRRP